MIEKIFLDMDGVLMNFPKSAAEAFGFTEQELMERWEPGQYDLAKAFGVTENEFWETVDRRGLDFWAKMEPYPWAKTLWKLAERFAPVRILTSPSRNVLCPGGKRIAAKKLFGQEFEGIFIGSDKDFISHPGAVLIDDSEKKVKKFAEAKNPGKAVLFPNRGNSLHKFADSPLGYVSEKLLSIAQEE